MIWEQYRTRARTSVLPPVYGLAQEKASGMQVEVTLTVTAHWQPPRWIRLVTGPQTPWTVEKIEVKRQ